MRLTTDFWVSALIRNVFRTGGFAAVVRRGATEAGAVFVTVRNRFGEVRLLGPAAQADYDTAKPDDRFFTEMDVGTAADAIDERLRKEERFDPDIWVIEIEPGEAGLENLLSLTTP